MNIDAAWDPSPNFWPGRNGKKPIAIVVHIEAGTEAGSDAWFANPASKVSAHYSISKEGVIHQHVRDQDTAWANGVLDRPDMSVPWIAELARGGANPNFVTLSIEHEGEPGQAFPEAQTAASRALIHALCETHGIPPDREHVVGHDQIDSVNRKDCPGPSFPWKEVLDMSVVRPAPAKPTSPPAGYVAIGGETHQGYHIGGRMYVDPAVLGVTLGAGGTVNGRAVETHVVDGRTVVNVPETALALGGTTSYNAGTNTVTVVLDAHPAEAAVPSTGEGDEQPQAAAAPSPLSEAVAELEAAVAKLKTIAGGKA